MATGTQYVLQGAEGMLNKNSPDAQTGGFGAGGDYAERAAGGGGDSDDSDDERKQISLYADQPTGVVQGLRHAYTSLARDLSVARDAIIAVPAEVRESSSATGAARVVIKHAPTIIFRPAIGASKAIGQTLMGATNSLDPQNLRRAEDVSFSPRGVCLSVSNRFRNTSRAPAGGSRRRCCMLTAC